MYPLLKNCLLVLLLVFTPCAAWCDTTRILTPIGVTEITPNRSRQYSADSAQLSLERAITESRANKDLLKEAKAVFYLSSILTMKGKYEQALTLLHPIVAQDGGSKLDSLKPHLYTKLSAVYLYLGNYRSAIAAIEKAQSYPVSYIPYQINLNVLTSNIWARLPKAYQPNGYQKALEYLDRAAVLAEGHKNKRMFGFVLNNQADLYLKLNQLDKCRGASERALAIARSNNDEQVLQMSLITMAELNYRENDVAKALGNLKDALNLKPSKTEVLVAVEGYLLLAKIYIGQKQYRKAEQILLFTENTLLEQKDKARLIQVYEIKSELFNQVGNFKNAFQYFKKYQKLQEEILGGEVAFGVKSLDLMYKETEKDKAILEGKLKVQKQAQEIQRKNFQIILLFTVLLCLLLVALVFYNRYRQRKLLDKQQIGMERLRAVIQGEELERARIAQELHDGIGGMLAVIGMHFSAAIKEDEKSSPSTIKIQELISRTSDEVRKTAHNLLPTALETNNLADAVEAFCNEISNTSNLIVDVETQGDFSGLDITFSIAVFRIIQEVFQNIIKHAQASHTVVIMEIEADRMAIHIEDNGNGFKVDELQSKGIGIKNIQDRVKNFGGTINIKSEAGIGTSVLILFYNLDNQSRK